MKVIEPREIEHVGKAEPAPLHEVFERTLGEGEATYYRRLAEIAQARVRAA